MTAIVLKEERIKEKSKELFFKYGIRSVSMDDIAHELGSSKKTIYHYFKDKDSLVYAIVKETLDENFKNSECITKASKDAVHEWFLTIEHSTELFKHMNPSLLNDLMKYHPKAFELFLEYKESYLQKELKLNYERGVEEGVFRKDIKDDVIIRFRLDSLLIPFNPDFYEGLHCSLFEADRELLIFFLYGLATLKGYKLITKYKEKFFK